MTTRKLYMRYDLVLERLVAHQEPSDRDYCVITIAVNDDGGIKTSVSGQHYDNADGLAQVWLDSHTFCMCDVSNDVSKSKHRLGEIIVPHVIQKDLETLYSKDEYKVGIFHSSVIENAELDVMVVSDCVVAGRVSGTTSVVATKGSIIKNAAGLSTIDLVDGSTVDMASVILHSANCRCKHCLDHAEAIDVSVK